MGWFDKLLYNLGQASPIGRAIEGAKQDSRALEVANSYANAKDLDQFVTAQYPNYQEITGTSDPRFLQAQESLDELKNAGLRDNQANIYDPKSLAELEKLKEARKGVLQQQEATQKGDQFVSDYRDIAGTINPRFFSDPESQQEMIKAGLKIPSSDNNPMIKKYMSDFTDKAQHADMATNLLAQMQSGGRVDPDLLASAALDEKLPSHISSLTEGMKRTAELTNTSDTRAREQAALKVYNEHPTVQTPESRADLISKVIQAAGTWDVASPILKRFDEAVNGPNLSVEQLTAKALNGDKASQAILDAIQARDIKKLEAARQVVVNNPLPAKMNINQLDENEQSAINRAIGNGTLDPYKVNSRNQKMLAGVILANPDADLNALAAQLGAARNKDIIMKAGVAEMIPDMLGKVVTAGKALKYSDVEFIGKVQKWKNGQLNDPKLTKYMALRNDQLLTIGGVMRSNGMTDMAQKLEEEALRPTLSPKALDGWLEGQLEAIDPRLNFYRSITKGNKAIPRSEYQTGTGVQGVNNLGKSKVSPVSASGIMKFDKYGNRVQ